MVVALEIDHNHQTVPAGQQLGDDGGDSHGRLAAAGVAQKVGVVGEHVPRDQDRGVVHGVDAQEQAVPLDRVGGGPQQVDDRRPVLRGDEPAGGEPPAASPRLVMRPARSGDLV